MYAQVVVPLDGGDASARALVPGLRLAKVCDSPLHVVGVTPGDVQLPALRSTLERQTNEAVTAIGSDARSFVTVARSGDAWRAIVDEVNEAPGSLVCMASRGRGRSAAFLGSTAEAIVRELTTPVIVIGPNVDTASWNLTSPMVVCVDGSTTSESILPIAASWSIALHVELEVVTVIPPQPDAKIGTEVLVDSNYVRGVAEKLESDTGRQVNFEVLHGDDAARELIEYVRERDASLVAAATHGHSGLKRMTAGSVTAALVRHASQPVLTYRPLELLR